MAHRQQLHFSMPVTHLEGQYRTFIDCPSMEDILSRTDPVSNLQVLELIETPQTLMTIYDRANGSYFI